jgi:osmotically inducible protein OsmC
VKVLYTAHAHATGAGRNGRTETDDGKVRLDLSVPKDMGGPGGDGTNPEQLFASGYAACFLGALRFVAGKEKVSLPGETQVAADVSIGPRDDGGGFGLEVALRITAPGVDGAVLEDLVQKAHVVCPYSQATRGNIPVALTVG